MDERELEKTKPINILSEISESRENKYKNELHEEVSREEKYKNSLIEEERMLNEEAAEEALAEKNIAMAESLLKEEKANENDLEPKKKSMVEKIKDKWSNLDKKKKIMVIVIALLLLVLITIFVIFLLTDKKEEEPSKKEPEVLEVAPTITDNFYYKDGKLYFLNANDEELGSYECENKDSKLCYVAFNNYRDGFDVPKLEEENGQEKIMRMPIYEDKYVFVIDNKEEKDTTVKLYSIDEAKVSNTYKSAKAYDDNYIIISDTKNKYGLIEIKDGIKDVIKPEYEALRMIDKEENLVAKTKKNIVIINKKNKVLSSAFDLKYDIRNYNDNFVVAYIAGAYNVYNYKADLLASGYDFITVADKYAALIRADKKVFIIDVEKNKYNEGNFEVANKNYVKTFVYSENGESKEIKRSFEMNVKESAIEIVVYKDGEDPTYNNVEYVEGLINKKNKYVNYFSGKLYFYKDEDKTELIGTYECTNKNYVSKETDNFDYCFPAKDTIYEDNDMNNAKRETMIPLINERFVFVVDGPNTVKLYNLYENKVIGTYTSVNSNLPSNGNTFNRYSGELNVIALNKKGKYGVLTINENAKGKYGFDYNRIEKIGEYYLAQDTDNKWKILYDIDRESGSVSGKIMGYSNNLKYMKVKTSNLYSVYTETGELTSEDTYLYVELYNDYYAAVDSDKNIYVYDYQGNKLTKSSIKLESTDYRNVVNPAFKVEKANSNSFNISVYDGTKYTVYSVDVEVNEEEPVLEE